MEGSSVRDEKLEGFMFDGMDIKTGKSYGMPGVLSGIFATVFSTSVVWYLGGSGGVCARGRRRPGNVLVCPSPF